MHSKTTVFHAFFRVKASDCVGKYCRIGYLHEAKNRGMFKFEVVHDVKCSQKLKYHIKIFMFIQEHIQDWIYFTDCVELGNIAKIKPLRKFLVLQYFVTAIDFSIFICWRLTIVTVHGSSLANRSIIFFLCKAVFGRKKGFIFSFELNYYFLALI